MQKCVSVLFAIAFFFRLLGQFVCLSYLHLFVFLVCEIASISLCACVLVCVCRCLCISVNLHTTVYETWKKNPFYSYQIKSHR